MELNPHGQDISQLPLDSEHKVDGTQIRRFRNWKGWSAKDLAEKVSVDPQHIYRIERNEARPSVDLLTKIAGTLGVSVSQLLGNQQPEHILIDERLVLEKTRNLDPLRNSNADDPHTIVSISNQTGFFSKNRESAVMLRGLKLAATDNFKVRLSVGTTATFDVPDHLADQFLMMLFDYSFSQEGNKMRRDSFPS